MPTSSTTPHPSPNPLRKSCVRSRSIYLVLFKKKGTQTRPKPTQTLPQPNPNAPITYPKDSNPMATNFEDILNRSIDDIKPPPMLPEGTYLCVVQGLPEQIESSKKKTPGLRFKLQVVQPLEDVDPAELLAFEGGVGGKIVNHDQWVTEDSLFMLKQFVEHCGALEEGASLSACIDNVPNSSVLAFIKHETSDETKRTFAKIQRTAPAA